MSLLAYNLTILPLPLAAGVPIVSLPASLSAGSRGPAMNVTGELKGLPAIGGFDLLQAQVAAGNVQYEWSGLPEFNTFTLVVGSAQTDVSDLPVQFWVNPSAAPVVTNLGAFGAGSDNNPGTMAAPFQTFDKAWSQLPQQLKNNSNRLFLASGDFDLLKASYVAPQPQLNGTPLIVQGSLNDEIGPQTAALASTNMAYVCSVDPVVADGSLRGAFLRNTATGARSLVTGNTTILGVCTINLVAPGIGVTAGDAFVVERPTSVLRAPEFGVPEFISNTTNLGLGLCDLKLSMVAEPGFGIPLFGMTGFMTFEGIDVDGGTSGRPLFTAHVGRWRSSEPIAWLSDTTPSPFSDDHKQATFYAHSANPFGMGFGCTDRSAIDVIGAVFDNVVLFANDLCNFKIIGINGVNVSSFFDNNSYVQIDTGVIDGCFFFSVGAIEAKGMVEIALGGGVFSGAPPLEIKNSVGHGVLLNGNGDLRAFGLIGSGNAGHGIAVSDASLARTNLAGPGSTLITGAAGDVLVGAVTKAYAALPYGEIDGSGPTGNRAQ
jgi:hypothetical protein